MSWIQKMKNKWGVGLWGFCAIMIAFSLAGMTVVRLRSPILNAILPPHAPEWLWWTTYLLLIFPLYQISLLAYGVVLGQGRFFWEKEKKLAQFIFCKKEAKHSPSENGATDSNL